MLSIKIRYAPISVVNIAPPNFNIVIPLPFLINEREAYFYKIYQNLLSINDYLQKLSTSLPQAYKNDLIRAHHFSTQVSDFCLRESSQTAWFERIFYTRTQMPSVDTVLSNLFTNVHEEANYEFDNVRNSNMYIQVESLVSEHTDMAVIGSLSKDVFQDPRAPIHTHVQREATMKDAIAKPMIKDAFF